MSVSISHVSGALAAYPDVLKKIARYIIEQNDGTILVISSIPGISQIIEGCLEKIHEVQNPVTQPEEQLACAWIGLRSGEPSEEYVALCRGVAGLLRGIELTGDCSSALKDHVLSFSERLSSVLLKECLSDFGVGAKVVLPGDIGLLVSEEYGNASCLSLRPEFTGPTGKEVWIVPGSFGVTGSGKTARCGWSAADYTAAFIASGLGAGKLLIWSGKLMFRTARHPDIAGAQVIPRLTYEEASELAYFDQGTFHPRTVEPLITGHIPIWVIDPWSESFEPETIINSENYIAPGVVKSVASTNDISVLVLKGPGVGIKPGILAKITGRLSELSINIKSVITSQVSINILLDGKSGETARKIAEEMGLTAVSRIELLEDITLLAVVGHGMQQNYGISAMLFGSLAEKRINILLSGSGASDLVSYLIVSSRDAAESVKAIHTAFFRHRDTFPARKAENRLYSFHCPN